ncbi:hypothetical protein PAXRUDRAFT_544514 [Paxillus rubicundulus Ve08.2h10]|uniref:Uncharacterized protein n=1 Tax=Paxillus rubicundulus Ve08.2h10 TaxID=930991 RepID=A0A0D0E601_9AGAM|nr:hypothetical protein PAXRUDRAFT_544514 [Paxillus rubicundulus Ve08.2h10]
MCNPWRSSISDITVWPRILWGGAANLTTTSCVGANNNISGVMILLTFVLFSSGVLSGRLWDTKHLRPEARSSGFHDGTTGNGNPLVRRSNGMASVSDSDQTVGTHHILLRHP